MNREISSEAALEACLLVGVIFGRLRHTGRSDVVQPEDLCQKPWALSVCHNAPTHRLCYNRGWQISWAMHVSLRAIRAPPSSLTPLGRLDASGCSPIRPRGPLTGDPNWI